MVTFVAVDVGVLAPCPLLVRLVMHMAGKTRIGVVLEVVVDLVCCRAHDDDEAQGSDGNDDLSLRRQFLRKPCGKIVKKFKWIQRHILP